VKFTIGCEATGFALWFLGGADVSSVEDEPMVGDGSLLGRDVAGEFVFDFANVFAGGKAYPS